MNEIRHEIVYDEIVSSVENQYLVFSGAGDLFAIDISYINEVIEYCPVRKIPHINRAVTGVINLRGTIVPVIDLSYRVYSRPVVPGRKTRILIIRLQDDSAYSVLGIMVDAVTMTVNIPPAEMAPVPDFGLHLRHDLLKGIWHRGNEIIRIINADVLCSREELSALDLESGKDLGGIFERIEEFSADTAAGSVQVETAIEGRNYLVTSLENELYGLSMDRVREITELGEIIHVPNAFSFLRGVVNLRGTAVPLVDLRLRCDLPEKAYDKKTSVVIVDLDDFLIGLAVDRVTDIVNLSAGAVQEIPHYSANISRDLIEGIAEYHEKFIVVLDVKKVLSEEEIRKARDSARHDS